MNEFGKTGVFVGGAAALILIAALARPGAVENDLFSDQGEAFYPDFSDPAQAASLEVWEFKEETGEAVPFKVKKDARGVWTIESHWNYPADAKTRMAKAATMVIGLKKEQCVSDRKDQHTSFGVLDPRDAGAELQGRGTRVTFRDAADNVLADLVVGKEVEGKMDVRYLCVPGKRRVYSAKLDAELSTRFEDWIERDLLAASSWDLSRITFHNYTFDEQRLEVIPGEQLVLDKDDSSKWVLAALGEEEITNDTRVTEVTSTLDDLKIVGVRPKPVAISGGLELRTGADRNSVMDLIQRGFFLARDGTLYANEGDLTTSTRNGVVYTLKFGEIVYGSGDAVTAGTGDAPTPPPQGGEQGPQPLPGNHRYMMIMASFDESLLKKPEQQRLSREELDRRRLAQSKIEAIVEAIDTFKQKNDGRLPASLQELTGGEEPAMKEIPKDPWEGDYVLEMTGESFTVSAYGDDRAKGGEGAATDLVSTSLAAEDQFTLAASEWKAYDEKVTKGQEEAGSLARRFGPWYYVIDQGSFSKLKPVRADLVKPKPVEPPGDDK